MQALRPRTKIRHALFGRGVVVESKNERTTIAFDTHGVKKFVTALMTVELGEEPKPPKPPKIPKPRVRIVSSFKPPKVPTVKGPPEPKGPRVNGGRPRFGSLPGEEATLERIKELARSGMGYRKVAVTLTAEGRTSRYGGKFNMGLIHVILLREGLRTRDPKWSRQRYGSTPEEAKTLDRIKAMRKQGMSFSGIARAFNEEGTKPRQGDLWWCSTVSKLLRRTA